MKKTIEQFLNEIGKTQEDLKGSLALSGCTGLTSLPDNLTVGGSLYLRGCTGLTSLPDNLTVGGSLDLEGCTGLTSLPDNLTVGGFLDLEGCTGLTSLPDNLTVGGFLDLRGCTGLTSLPDNLTVGGSLYSDINFKIHPKNINPDFIFQWRNGKYIKVDGVMTEVLHKRGNVRKVRIVGQKEDSYLVTDGNGKWAHGKTLAKAKEDLSFKIISEKMKKDPINKDTVITTQYYRIVTGACELGVKSWMQQNNITSDRITAGELLPLLAKTKAYGYERFKQLVTF